METTQNIVILTKKYIIELLNALLFSETMSWEGKDQYNSLPVFNLEEGTSETTEQRGALLVHKTNPWGLRLLVSISTGDSKKVCYRLTNLYKELDVSALNRKVKPLNTVCLDFSISDLNLAVKDDSALSFHDNIGKSNNKVFNLLRFLLESEFVSIYDSSIFSDMLYDDLSLPPLSSDVHYSPIFEV
jgi:hypothetical protein